MYVLDFGANNATLYDSKRDSIKFISQEQVLKLPFELPPGSKVICEYAHLGCPRKRLSRAQPYTEQQLLKLYLDFASNGIELRLFPHQSTPRACNYSQQRKSNVNDPKCIFVMLKDFPRTSLMKPPSSFDVSSVRLESYDFKYETNEILNVARRYDYKSDEDQNTQFLRKHINEISERLSASAKEAFGIGVEGTVYKRNNKRTGVKVGDININPTAFKMTQVYSILSLLQDDRGILRFRKSTGRLPGWKFIKRYVLCMSPFHFKGGIARSNLYYHGIRNWVPKQIAKELNIKFEYIKKKSRGGYFPKDDKPYVPPYTKLEDETYLKYRKIYCDAIKELFMIFKEILIRENNLGILNDTSLNNEVLALIPN